MKNRNIALLLAAGMLLGLLTGCGSETASAVSAPSAEVTEASEATETPAEPVSAEESAASKADQVASAGEMTRVAPGGAIRQCSTGTVVSPTR